MIPKTNDDLISDFVFEDMPTKTFKANWETKRISGFVDDVEAVKQAIFIILNVERYAYIIHSWNFGIEMVDLIGQPIPFVLPEIKRRVTEALLQDTRITGVEGFQFEIGRRSVHATFTALTIYGEINAETVVNI